MSKGLTRILFLCFLTSAGAARLFAQTDSEINSGIKFNFSNPGARSLGLGGAFIALADDATAAYTNPAGLTNLSKVEVSIEGRRWQYTNQYLDQGKATITLSSAGETDDFSGLIDAKTKDSVSGLSFASFVYPQNRWAVAVYRHELARFRASAQTTGAFFDIKIGPDLAGSFRFNPVIGSVDLKIVNYGAALALRLGNNFSLGVGGSRFQYRQTTRNTRYLQDGVGNPARATLLESVDGDDSAYAVNAGILWRITRTVSLGGVYRQGPKFTFDASVRLGPASPVQGESTARGTFRVPDVYGAGMTLRGTDFLTIAFDWNRVRYSQFTNNFVPVLTGFNSSDYRLDDGNEFRLGLQYAIPIGTNVLALRAGGWRDPDHKVRFLREATSSDPAGDAIGKVIERLLFRSGNREYHYSVGLGLALGEHFQVDAAADIAKSVKTGAVSMVARF